MKKIMFKGFEFRTGEIYNFYGCEFEGKKIENKESFAKAYLDFKESLQKKEGKEIDSLYVTSQHPERLTEIGFDKNEIISPSDKSLLSPFINQGRNVKYLFGFDCLDVQKTFGIYPNDGELLKTLFEVRDLMLNYKNFDNEKDEEAFILIYANPDILSPEYRAIFQENVIYPKFEKPKAKRKNLSLKLE